MTWIDKLKKIFEKYDEKLTIPVVNRHSGNCMVCGFVTSEKMRLEIIRLFHALRRSDGFSYHADYFTNQYIFVGEYHE